MYFLLWSWMIRRDTAQLIRGITACGRNWEKCVPTLVLKSYFFAKEEFDE